MAVLSHKYRLLEGNLQALSALELTLFAVCCEAVEKLRQLGALDCKAGATTLWSCSGLGAVQTGADVEASTSAATGKYADRLCEASRIAGAAIDCATSAKRTSQA